MRSSVKRRSKRPETRPEIQFIPLSTDEGKIRFFGTLMPSLLLLKESPRAFLAFQIRQHLTPQQEVADFIATDADDAARLGDTLIFVHRWRSISFDPLAFARARTFLTQLARLVRREGYRAEPLDPLSPNINLPRLAAQGGLGNLSPYGLLVHPIFGPRLILTALKTGHPVTVRPRFAGDACFDCMACVALCPQRPHLSGIVDLGQCQTCAKCFEVCPIGKGRHSLDRARDLSRIAARSLFGYNEAHPSWNNDR